MIPRTLFLLNNAPGVSWWRMVMFFKNMVKFKPDTCLYGWKPRNDEIALFESRFEEDKLGKKIRPQIYQLMKWCEVAVMGFARYPSTISLIEGFKSNLPEVRANTNGPKRIVCDIDDYVIDTPTYNPAYRSGWKPGGVFGWVSQEHMRLADVIFNATPWLAEEHKKYNKNSIVIPNCIDEEWFDVKKTKRKCNKIRIGWAGGGNHDEDFRVLSRVIKVITDKYKDVEFYFVHGAPSYIRCLKGVKAVNDWVHIEDYPKLLEGKHFDIAIAPLDLNRFNAGKSNIKFLENSMFEIPGVYQDYNPYEMVKHGETGLKANKSDDWIDCLCELIENETLRKKIGKKAKEYVLKEYNIKDWVIKYMDILKSLI